MLLHWDMEWAENLVAIVNRVVLRSVDNPSWAVGVGVFVLVGIFLWRRRRD